MMGKDTPADLIYDGNRFGSLLAVEWVRSRSGPADFEFFSCHSEDLPRRPPPPTRRVARARRPVPPPGSRDPLPRLLPVVRREEASHFPPVPLTCPWTGKAPSRSPGIWRRTPPRGR